MRKIDIVLLDNPSDGNGFVILLSAPNYFYSNADANIFKNTPTADNHILIGGSLSATIDNLYNKKVSDYSTRPFITVVKNTNGITIKINDDLSTSSTISINGDITVTHSDVVVEPFTRDNIILSRSPFNLLFSPSALFDIVAMNLTCYRGEQTIDAPATPTFSLSKASIQAGQDTIRFEISKLINDYTKNKKKGNYL